MSGTKTKKKEAEKSKLDDQFSLVLWNDEVNSFDDIIDALVDICDHSTFQAEQCATIAHYKGKCPVKSDEPLDKLLPMKRSFDSLKINTTIE